MHQLHVSGDTQPSRLQTITAASGGASATAVAAGGVSPHTRSRRPRTRSRLTASPAAAHNSADRDHRAFSSVLKGTDSECSSLVFIFGVD